MSQKITHEPAPRYQGGDSPLPTPDGWFCLGLADEFKPGTVATRRIAGQDLVVYRTRGGDLNVIRPYCPHLGAHLGNGGTVAGEEIICPFHGFAFGTDGVCTRTGYGTRPPKIALTRFHVREKNGLVMVWHHHASAAPTWEIPDLPRSGHCPPVASLSEFPGHPQEVTENFFDTGHIQVLHNKWIESAEVPEQHESGPSAHLILRMHFRLPLLKARWTEDYAVDLHGLGYAVVDITLPGGILIRNWITTTLVDAWRVHLRLVATARVPMRGIGRPLGALLARLLARFVLWLHTEQFVRAPRGDIRMWATKEYLPRPRLAAGDGKITRLRRWARQFYPTGASAAPVPAGVTDGRNDMAEAPAGNGHLS
jgi:nitrite reductase/ring-hydroxylating ferredoxin subunit